MWFEILFLTFCIFVFGFQLGYVKAGDPDLLNKFKANTVLLILAVICLIAQASRERVELEEKAEARNF